MVYIEEQGQCVILDPILMQNKSDLRKNLNSKQGFTQWLADYILSLPCDQLVLDKKCSKMKLGNTVLVSSFQV